MSFKLNIVNKLSFDVAVIGGGTAGVFAAISAAKNGAKTILIEKNSILGGTITTANVNIPGLFFAWGEQVISGPCWDAIKRCEKSGGAIIPEIQVEPQHHWIEQVTLNRFVYMTVLWELIKENNITVMTNAMVSAAEETDHNAKLLVTSKEGLWEIDSTVCIDATGDANLVQIAGYPLQKSESQQPATLQNHICGYDLSNVDLNVLHENFKKELFPEYIKESNLLGYLQENMINVHTPCKDADTSFGKTRVERDALQLMMKIYSFYRKIPGLENLTVDFVAEETGIRETNRILGETTITATDYINGCFYEDSVCYSFYPIDRHVMGGIKQQFFEKNVVGKIPYSALIPKGAKRILCAGRCISSDTDANSALRVQASCMAMGQVAGCAAAICSDSGGDVKNVPYQTLCDRLRKIGAIVPEK